MSAKDSRSIKTYIVSTNHFLFSGLQATLSHVTTTTMANENDHDAIQQDQPHLIILDMASHKNVMELIRQLKDTVPDANILLLGGVTDLKRTREALTLGVDGVVLTEQPPEVLLATVNTLIHSPPSAAPVTTNGCSLSQPIAVSSASLTQRERDIVRLVGQGLSNKEIANQACISVITVRHHLTSIFDKLGVASRQKLLIHVHQVGMI
jgi:DNA-binding NarL/FixJ family response regulator